MSALGRNRIKEPAPWYRREGDGLILRVRVQPRAARTAVAGIQDNSLRLRLTSPPVDGSANRQARDLLAKLFGVSRSHVTLLRGARHRDKVFRISDPARDPEEVVAKQTGTLNER